MEERSILRQKCLSILMETISQLGYYKTLSVLESQSHTKYQQRQNFDLNPHSFEQILQHYQKPSTKQTLLNILLHQEAKTKPVDPLPIKLTFRHPLKQNIILLRNLHRQASSTQQKNIKVSFRGRIIKNNSSRQSSNSFQDIRIRNDNFAIKADNNNTLSIQQHIDDNNSNQINERIVQIDNTEIQTIPKQFESLLLAMAPKDNTITNSHASHIDQSLFCTIHNKKMILYRIKSEQECITQPPQWGQETLLIPNEYSIHNGRWINEKVFLILGKKGTIKAYSCLNNQSIKKIFSCQSLYSESQQERDNHSNDSNMIDFEQNEDQDNNLSMIPDIMCSMISTIPRATNLRVNNQYTFITIFYSFDLISFWQISLRLRNKNMVIIHTFQHHPAINFAQIIQIQPHSVYLLAKDKSKIFLYDLIVKRTRLIFSVQQGQTIAILKQHKGILYGIVTQDKIISLKQKLHLKLFTIINGDFVSSHQLDSLDSTTLNHKISDLDLTLPPRKRRNGQIPIVYDIAINGNLLAVLFANKLSFYSMQKCIFLHSITFVTAQPNFCQFISPQQIVIAFSRKLEIYETKERRTIQSQQEDINSTTVMENFYRRLLTPIGQSAADIFFEIGLA